MPNTYYYYNCYRYSLLYSQHFGQMPPVEVCYDEFTEDIEENRLLKAATFLLLKALRPSNNNSNGNNNSNNNNTSYSSPLIDQLRISLKKIDNKLGSVSLVIDQYDPYHLPGRVE